MSSGLYGIHHSNRDKSAHWTKNCFNSSFPAALACYMMEKNIPAIYAKLADVNGKLQIVCDLIEIRELFRCGDVSPSDLRFDFESKFDPYQRFAFDAVDNIDLVVKSLDGTCLAPVEVKLTVLPTSGTSEKPENEWGCELVIRTATTSYCAFSMWDSVKDNPMEVREIFEQACADIGSWTNDFEMAHKTIRLKETIDIFERTYLDKQKPLVMQPIWKTQGQNPILAEHAFDIVVWSDYAFTRLFLETKQKPSMSRPMRATARLARCLWELSKSGKIRVEEIYRQMAFGQQTDKEVAVNGDEWRRYITSDRVIHPIIPREAIYEIIEEGRISNLKPERRLDQTIVLTDLFQRK